MEKEAETGVSRPHTRGLPEPPEARKGRKWPPLEPVEGVQPCPAWPSDVWSPGLER